MGWRDGNGISREDLDYLSRSARILYAARCARRVLPIFAGFNPEDRAPVEAVEWAEARARGEPGDEARGQKLIEGALESAHGIAQLEGPANAALSAALAARTAMTGLAHDAVQADEFSAYAVAGAFPDGSFQEVLEAVAQVQAALSRDYASLLFLGIRDEPLEPEALGALWPDFTPSWFSRFLTPDQRDGFSPSASTAP